MIHIILFLLCYVASGMLKWTPANKKHQEEQAKKEENLINKWNNMTEAEKEAHIKVIELSDRSDEEKRRFLQFIHEIEKSKEDKVRLHQLLDESKRNGFGVEEIKEKLPLAKKMESFLTKRL